MSAKKTEKTGLRLLIADDDPLIRMDLRSVLEGAGYHVVAEMGSGTEALEACRRLAPDLAVLDFKMPGLDGVEVAATLHRERIAPVVLLTAYSQKELVLRATDAGVLSYIVKPFREPALLAAIEVAHSQWQTLRQRETYVRSLKEKEAIREAVDCAKKVLMATCGLDEARAYRFIQKRSMNMRRSMREVAEAILISHSVLHQTEAETTGAVREAERVI